MGAQQVRKTRCSGGSSGPRWRGVRKFMSTFIRRVPRYHQARVLIAYSKSQLAIQHAHQIRDATPDTYVFWVHASTRARFEEAYQGIAEKLGSAVQAISLFLSAFIVALAIQWKLALIVSSIVPVIITIMVVAMGFEARLEAPIVKLHSQAASQRTQRQPQVQYRPPALPLLLLRVSSRLFLSACLGLRLGHGLYD